MYCLSYVSNSSTLQVRIFSHIKFSLPYFNNDEFKYLDWFFLLDEASCIWSLNLPKNPNGYNLTDGGQSRGSLKGTKILLDENEIVKPTVKKNRDLTRSEYTKSLISKRLTDFKSDPIVREKQMETTQKQHTDSKFKRFKNVIVDPENIEKYIFVINNNTLKYQYVRIIINKVKANFIGKYENIEIIKARANKFIQELIKWQRDQIAGNPLEPSTTTYT